MCYIGKSYKHGHAEEAAIQLPEQTLSENKGIIKIGIAVAIFLITNGFWRGWMDFEVRLPVHIDESWITRIRTILHTIRRRLASLR